MESLQRKILRIGRMCQSHTKVSTFWSIVILVSVWFTSSGDLYLANALSQESHPLPLKPIIYVDLSRWENRSTHPRFLLFREHFRRQLGTSSSTEENLSSLAQHVQQPEKDGYNFMKPGSAIISSSTKESKDEDKGSMIQGQFLQNVNSEQEEYNDEDDISSLEKLLSERNGIIPKDAMLGNAQPKVLTSLNGGNGKKPIIFPKDKTNPCNRLQINLEEEQVPQPNPLKEEESNVDSLEISNRESFFFANSTEDVGQGEENEEELKLIRDAVPTFDLAMNIIKLSKWDDNNALFSPLSIANVLSMLMLGSEGETFKELSALLERDNSSIPGSSTINSYHTAFNRLINYLRALSGEQVILSMASEVYLDKSYPVMDNFRNDLLKYYEAPVESYDFSTDGKLFQDKVNQWAKEKTQGQIETILEEPPSTSTVMGIINAIYFKGSWEIPFSDKLTRWKDFRVDAKETMKAQMMVNILNVPYIQRELYEMIALPYKQNLTGLYIILPKGDEGIKNLENVEKFITKEELQESIALMNSTKVAVSLPKLKYSSDGKMEEILQNMNLTTLFTPGNANFNGISSKRLFISSLLHRAVVEINEKGTEASAVSLGTGDRIIEDLPVPFRCDKPFLFFIYHVKADTILFWGRVVRPSHSI